MKKKETYEMYVVAFVMLLMTVGSCDNATDCNKDVAGWSRYCDTSYNYTPPPDDVVATYDGNKLPVIRRTYRGKMSPSKRYMAFLGIDSDYKYSDRNIPIWGLYVMDVNTYEFVGYVPYECGRYEWSGDSRVLYFISNGTLKEYEVETGSINEYSNLGVFEDLAMSPTKEFMYISGYKRGIYTFSLVRWDMVSSEVIIVTDNPLYIKQYIPISNNRVCSVILRRTEDIERGCYIINIKDGTIDWQEIYGPEEIFSGRIFTVDLSPDCTKIMMDPAADGSKNDGYGDIGIWVYNIETKVMTQVLRRHSCYLFERQNPEWISNESYLADYLCVHDSSVSVYQYNLDGTVESRYEGYYAR